jgi:hypothetical protein
MHKFFFTLIFLSFFTCLFGQEIPIGTWRDHLSYTDAISVAYGNDIAYCATSSAIFMYDKSDESLDRLSLVNGLSDIGISKIKYNTNNNKLIITYDNGNIDIVDENKNIVNLSYIKNSNIIADKSINHIFIAGDLAYLSTGFGVVLIDTDKLEVDDTYLIADLGGYINVNSVTIDDTSIYAATNEGIYFANKNNVNLADYNNWNKIPELGNKTYSNINYYNNLLFASSDSSVWLTDTIYFNQNGIWQKFLPDGFNVRNITVSQNKLLISLHNGVKQINKSLVEEKIIYKYRGTFTLSPYEAVLTQDLVMIVAEESHGIIQAKSNWDCEIIAPNSPSSSNALSMDIKDGELWTVSGGYGLGLDKNLVNHKTNGEWVNLGETVKDINDEDAQDMVNVIINPSNTSQVYVSSWTNGLFEYRNDKVVNIYTGQNSLLDTVFYGVTAIGAMAFDDDNNLWVTSSYSANNQLAVKTADNKWYNYSFTGLTTASDFYTQMIIDKNNYKWFIAPKKHTIFIFDDNGTIENTSDDRKKVNSNFPGSHIESIVQDKDGEIWIGTDEGIAVFYNPDNVFDENIEAEQILIQQDGQTQLLLETETITVIAIDGANRKWVGTQNSGVYLMSQDGTEQIEHFTTENSPLFSNNILDIVIDPKTGEVYIGTAKGLISYKGTATEPDEDFNNIFVYPNPVKPDFNGKIAIRGLVKDTDVRITDISGNIVYETTSFGGQAIWNGNDMNGNRVQSGVYMVFNGSQDGSKKAAAKILFIN